MTRSVARKVSKRDLRLNARKMIENAVGENPEIALVLEISARARENERKEPMMESIPAPGVAANPVVGQGGILHYLGHVLSDERHLIPGLK